MWGKKHYRTFEKWAEALAIEFEPLYNYDRFEEYLDEKVGTNSRKGSEDRTEADVRLGSRQHSGINDESTSNSRESQAQRNDVENVINNSTATTGTTGTRSSANSEVVGNGGTTENTVSAFDSSSYEPKDRQIQSGNQTTTGTTGEASETDSTSTGTSGTTTAGGSVNTESGSDQSSKTSSVADVSDESESRTNLESRTNREDNINNEVVKHTAHLYGNIGVTTSAQLLREFLDVERFNIYEQIADLFIDEFCILVY